MSGPLIEGLSLEANMGLKRLFEDQFGRWPDAPLGFPEITPERIAWVAIRLQYVEDRVEWFPKGKWATIQRIRDLLEIEARKLEAMP